MSIISACRSSQLERKHYKLTCEKTGVAVEEYQDRYGAQGLGRSIYLKDIAGNTVELRNVM